MPQSAHGADIGARFPARGRQPGDSLLCTPFLPVRDLELAGHPLPVPAALPRVGTCPAGRGLVAACLRAKLLPAAVQRQFAGVVVTENRTAARTSHDDRPAHVPMAIAMRTAGGSQISSASAFPRIRPIAMKITEVNDRQMATA